MKRRAVWIVFILLASGRLSPSLGQTAGGAAFLKIGVGARALGMGGSFAAVADEAGAVYWNPAGLDLFHRTKVEATYSRLSLNRSYDTGALSQPIGKYGSLGLSWIRFGVDKIELRTDDTADPEGYGNDKENAYLASYSKSILGFLSFGVTGKYVTQELLGRRATASGADLGLLLRMTNGWSLGLVTQNIGAKLSWPGGHKDPLPRVTKLGVANQILNGRLLTSCDRISSNQEKSEIRFGVEGKVSPTWSLRCGYGRGEVSLGTGVLAPLPWAATRLDYVFGTDRLGQHPTHRFALAVSL
jgi:hypothetical protein